MGVSAKPESGIHEQGSIINQAELASRIREIVQNTIREELTTLKQLPVQPVQTEPADDCEMTDTIMSFLDNFM